MSFVLSLVAMSKRSDDHQRQQSSTVPAVVFSSAFQSSLSPRQPASATVDDDGSTLQSLHIAVDDDVTPQPSPLPADSPDSTVPQFHYDPEEEDLSPPEDLPTSQQPHSLPHSKAKPHSDISVTPATTAARHQPASSNTAAPAAHTLVVAVVPSSTSPPVSSVSQPSAIPPLHSTTSRPSTDAKSTCRVVSCTERAERDGYCLPHYALFKPNTQPAVEESSELKAKREKKERKGREQQLALLKEKSSTMPSPTSPNVSAASAHSSNLHTAATAHSSLPPPGTSSSPSSSPGWFSRRKMSNEAKEPRGGSSGTGDCDGDDGVGGDVLLVETRRAWRLANKVVSKDVPRLAKRMSVIDDKRVCVLWGRTVQEEEVDRATKPRLSVSVSLSQQEALAEEEAEALAHPQPKDDEKQQSAAADPPSPKSRVKGKEVVEAELPDISTWQAISNVVLAVAEHLESPDTVARTREHFHRVALTLAPHTDLEAPLSDVLNQTLGLGSHTFAVFRATHQSILFPAVYSLKTNLYTQVGAMKDVRRHDGWQVEIYIGDGRVWITHVRREQSMEPEDSPTHFEVEWEIRLSFDRAMEECRAVFLRIQNLQFHPQMPRERKQQIVQVLKGAGYIV